MKRSIFSPASVYKPVMPFPMPEPQRGQVMKILVAECRKANVPPALIVTHLPRAEEREHTALRAVIWRRVFAEVPDVSIRMVAIAFRRDAHQVRNALNADVVAPPPPDTESK